MEALNNKKVLMIISAVLVLIAVLLAIILFVQSNKSLNPKVINLPGTKEQKEASKTDQSAPPAEDKGQDIR